MFVGTPQVLRKLMEIGLISEAEWRKTLDLGEEDAEKYLLENDFLTENQLLRIDGKRSGHLFADLEKMEIDPEIVRSIPRCVSRKYLVAVIEKNEKTIKLAMVNPLNVFAIDDIKMMTQKEISVCISSERLILATIEKAWEGRSPED